MSFAFKKWKMFFFVKQVGTSLWQHCLPSQDGVMRPIWAYYQKLFNGCGHIIASLAWKPWIFVHGRSFFRTLIQENTGIASLVFLLVGRPHLMMWRRGLPFFFDFFEFFTVFSKTGQFRRGDRPWLGFEPCKSVVDSVMECLPVKLKSIFSENNGQAMEDPQFKF